MLIDFLERFLAVKNHREAARKTLLVSLIVAYAATFTTYNLFGFFASPWMVAELGQRSATLSFCIAFVLSIGFVAAFMAVSLRLNNARAKLEEMARNDSLTGLLNRRAFFQEIDLRRRAKSPGNAGNWFLLIDADRFKQINDDNGHAAGDLVLTMIAMVLKGNVFDRDLIARIGGEEFAVYLHNTNAEGVAIAAERIRAAIEENTVYFESRRIKVTVSVGCAEIGGGEDILSAMSRADRSLYEAKNAGRNAVIISNSRVEFTAPNPGRRAEDQKSAIRLVSNT